MSVMQYMYRGAIMSSVEVNILHNSDNLASHKQSL